MKVKIHPNTLDKVKDMLNNSDKYLKNKSLFLWLRGLNIEVVLDEQHENDDVVMDNGIEIRCRQENFSLLYRCNLRI